MVGDLSEAMAARELGLRLSQLRELQRRIKAFGDKRTVIGDLRVYRAQSKVNAVMWRLHVHGFMAIDGATADFRHDIIVDGILVLRGASPIPDRYAIAYQDQVLFRGDVDTPDDDNDDAGWARYNVFEPIRLRIVETVLAGYIAGILEIQDLTEG